MCWPASLIIAVVIGHFFLFCNGFRISRRPELIWAGIFIVLSVTTILPWFPVWTVTIAISICATITVVICEMKNPSSHGVGWRKINPHLKNWWDLHLAGKI
jgi:hypothetical protein